MPSPPLVDHYAELEIGRDATPEEIRKAHRSKLLRVHPDHGGGREEFDRVQRAYEVLSDPARKARYDATGADDGSETADLRRAKVQAEVAKVMAMVIASGFDVEHNDVRTWALSQLQVTENNLADQVDATKGKLEMCEALRARFHRKAAGEVSANANALTNAIDGHQRQLKDHLAMMEDLLALHREIMAVFQAFDYRVDPTPQGLGEREMAEIRAGRPGYRQHQQPSFFRAAMDEALAEAVDSMILRPGPRGS